MTPPNESLLPCPMCKHEYVESKKVENGELDAPYYIQCKSFQCFYESPKYQTAYDCVVAWNTRPTTNTTTQEQAERLWWKIDSYGREIK